MEESSAVPPKSAVRRQDGVELVRPKQLPGPSGHVAPNLSSCLQASHELALRGVPLLHGRGLQSPKGNAISPSEFDPARFASGGLPQYLMIEFCCSATSRIGAACPTDAIVIRCTEEDDVVKATTLAQLQAAVQCSQQLGVPVVLWGSIPCTGGSQWQVVNRARFGVTAKLQRHWAQFRKHWTAFRTIAATVLQGGGLVANEWPLRCAYWHDRKVGRFIAHFHKAVIHGCMHGMRPVGPHAEDQFIGKAWRVDSSDEEFSKFLDLRCDGQHRHITVAGSETTPSGFYPHGMAQAIHTGAEHFARRFRGARA